MKSKQLIILVVIFVSILALGILKNFRRAQLLEKSSDLHVHFKWGPQATNRIEFGKGDELQAVLEKENNVWRLPQKFNAPADTTLITALFDAITHATGEIRANDQKLFSDFQIGDSEGFHLTFKNQNQPILELILSAKIPASGGVFIREKNSSIIYLVNQPLFAFFGIVGNAEGQKANADYWVDFALFRGKLDQLDSVVYQRLSDGKMNPVFELAREGNRKWGLKNSPGEIDLAKVNDFLQKLTRANATQALDPKGSYGLDIPSSEIVIRSKGESIQRIMFKEAPKDLKLEGYCAKVDGREGVYLVSSYTFQSLTPASDSFLSSTNSKS